MSNDPEDTARIFSSLPLSPAGAAQMREIRTLAMQMASRIKLARIADREESIALQKLEEAVYWAQAGVSRVGVDAWDSTAPEDRQVWPPGDELG